MRILSLLLITFTLVFSINLTPAQLEMAKAAGYSEADIQKALANQNSPKSEEILREQTVDNDIVENSKEVEKQDLQMILNGNFNDTQKMYDQKAYGKIQSNPNDMKVPNLFSDFRNSKSTEKISEFKLEEKLPRFGELFFNNKNKLNPYSIPTPSNYNLNFGDKITLKIYGSTNQEFDLSIDNNGNVVIPQVGELQLIGLAYSDAKKLIIEESKKAFPNSTNILVDMLEYASIQVTISGFVNAPGLYNLASFSTIKDALITSGGILENGSYRNIYLKRDGKVKKVFDLYQLVRYGNINSDEMLQNGDVVLVKPKGKEIKLTGDINYNALYELKNNESFKDLINYAAGFKPSANKNAIKLKRYENSALKVYTLNSSKLFKKKPKSGDEVHIYPISLLGGKLVKIDGNVVAPGERELPKDKKLSTLLASELKQFGKNTYFEKDTNYNYAIVQNDNKIKSFNLKKVLGNKEDVSLTAGDEIIIYKNDEFQEKPYVFAAGNVVNKLKQKYDFYEGMSAKDLFDIVLFKSDEIDEKTSKRISLKVDKTKVQVSRLEDNQKVVYLIKNDELSTFKLKKFDDVKFFEYSMVNNIRTATIKGEIFIPGTYDISENMNLKSMINLAGGFTKKTLFSRFEIVRYETVEDERKRKVLALDLTKALDLNIQILPDDEITIFPIANWNEKMYIEITGLVRFPGKYPIVEGEKLSSVIERAGGFLKEAFIEGSVFTREEVRILQQKRLEESIDRLKRKVFQSNLSATEAGESTKEKQDMLNTVEMLEKESDLNKPIGRISLNLYYDLKRFKNSKYDITLKDKDTLFIPSINDTIAVVGEVLNQTTFVYDKELEIDDYINKSGGLSESADDEYIYVVKANGEAIKHEKKFFWDSSSNVFKGDTIVVPLKLDTISDIAFAKDVSSILYQFAVTAASLKTVGGI